MYLTGKVKNKIALLFSITYMVSYITRINYGAIISEMELATGESKQLLSMAVTGSFITYGVGQIISGIFGDLLSPKKLVSSGLALTVLMNFLIPLCQNPYQMLGVWCINGFAQAFMWPPLVKLMIMLFSQEDYPGVVVRVLYGSSLGTIFVYLVSPFLIMLSGWKAVFIFCALCGLLMLVLWIKHCPSVQLEKTSKKQETSARKQSFFTPMLFGIMISIICMGMLRDGITTWLPSYVSETYKMSNLVAILFGVILPVFSMAAFKATSEIYARKFKSPLTCAGAIFILSTVLAALLLIMSGANAVLSILLMSLLTACMHGINLMLITMVPPFFSKTGNVSTVSGVLNACTYIGSAISTYGIAVVTENFGWNASITIWLFASIIGMALCYLCVGSWNKKFN